MGRASCSAAPRGVVNGRSIVETGGATNVLGCALHDDIRVSARRTVPTGEVIDAGAAKSARARTRFAGAAGPNSDTGTVPSVVAAADHVVARAGSSEPTSEGLVRTEPTLPSFCCCCCCCCAPDGGAAGPAVGPEPTLPSFCCCAPDVGVAVPPVGPEPRFRSVGCAPVGDTAVGGGGLGATGEGPAAGGGEEEEEEEEGVDAETVPLRAGAPVGAGAIVRRAATDAPVAADSIVGATGSDRVLSAGLAVVGPLVVVAMAAMVAAGLAAPRGNSRGTRRSSAASAPRRASAPGRGSGCQCIDCSTSPENASGGSDIARGAKVPAPEATAASCAVALVNADAPCSATEDGAPGELDAGETLGAVDEFGAVRWFDGSTNGGTAASLPGRVGPTCRPGPEACAARRALPPPVDGDGGPTVDRRATARARSRLPSIGPAARTSSGLATKAASVTIRCEADDGPVSMPAGDRRPRDVARGNPRGPAAAACAAKPRRAVRCSSRRWAACTFCSMRDGDGRIRSRSRSATANHRSSCMPTGRSSVPLTLAATFWPSMRRARIERPLRKPKRAALAPTLPARRSGATRASRRACGGS
ncbi:MAG: hypothetical protein QOH79_2578 [Acidimicrobiaceae bacterium]